MKHFQTPAGSKRGFKSRIIAISPLLSYKENSYLSTYGFSSFAIGMDWPPLCLENQGTFSGMPLSDPTWITYCSKAVTGEIYYLDKFNPIHPFKNILITRFPGLVDRLLLNIHQPTHIFVSFLSHHCIKCDIFNMCSVFLKYSALKWCSYDLQKIFRHIFKCLLH